MEAALAFQIPLSAYVRFTPGGVVLDKYEITDETAIRLLRESEDPGALLADMVEIGARVLDRESTGANVEFVRNELEKVGRDMDRDFSDKARLVAEFFSKKVDEVFSEESGTLTKALEKHFSEDSSTAVQHQVKAVIAEVTARSREDLVRQFSAADGNNPLAGFQRAALHSIKTAADQQHAHLREMNETIVGLRAELAALKAEKEKREDVAAAEERGAAKGRTYEEAVFEAIDVISVARGDDCDAVGDTRGEGGRKGDVVVAIDACAGPARGRIVFEAKDRKLSKNQALEELDGAMATRSADFGILVVPSEDELPARTHPLREYNGDKLFVVYDPEDGSRLALEVAYGLARARVLMARDESVGLDVAAARAEVERALGAMEDVRRIKSQLTNATNGIESARGILDTMAAGVRAHLAALDALLMVEAEPVSTTE